MKRLPATLLLAAAAALSGSARAELPFPFGEPPEAGKLPQCTKAYVQSVEGAISGMEKLRSAGPALLGRVCSLIETGSDLLGGELSDSTRQQLKELLGIDVDLRFIRTQCRVSQGNLDREVMSQIGYLKSELMRCTTTI